MDRQFVLLLTCFVFVTLGCAPESADRPAEEPSAGQAALAVRVVNYPLGYFAERIGGGRVRVSYPETGGEDPAYWSPDAETVVAYQQADLILLNGAGYAKWVERAALPRTRVVDTSAALEDRLIPVDDSVTHSHGPTGEHSHRGHAFTTWLDPTLAVEQARAILNRLVEERPQHETEFRESFAALEADLLEIDGRFEEWAGTVGDTPLVFSHPVYQYFVRRYGLQAVSVHWEPEEPPEEEQWHELEQLRRGHPARWMIWEGRPLDDTVERLRASGMESVTFAPGAVPPESADLLANLRDTVEALHRIRP